MVLAEGIPCVKALAVKLRVYVCVGGVATANKSLEVSSARRQSVLYAKLESLNFTFCPVGNGQITGGFKRWADVSRIAFLSFSFVTLQLCLVKAETAVLHSAMEV